MNRKRQFTRLAASATALLLSSQSGRAQFTAPNITSGLGASTVTLGNMTFTNLGLQGVGRISGSSLDAFNETFGSVSSLQISNWSGSGGVYTGTFNILPDRGYNNNNAGGFFSDYAARLQQVNFTFTPYTDTANIGGSDTASRIAAQTQISFTSPITGTKFTYTDPNTGSGAVTTGLDPGSAGKAVIFGKTVPYVTSYTGQPRPGDANQTYTNINKLAIDAEGLVLKSDGSGYVSDEYGANVYYFNANKEITGVITPPAAVQPHAANGDPNFISTVAPADGRRNNQGLEGVALSPDGTKLFTLLQSGTVQDSGSAQQNRQYTRLAVYDVSGNATPDAPTAEYVLQLPTYTQNGGSGAVNATAAQSEIVAIDSTHILVLARDANGQGSVVANPSVYKSVLLVDLSTGNATNIAGTGRDNTKGLVTTSPGVLDPSITALSSVEALNMLNSTQLGKFNISLDLGGTNQVSQLTLGEKWEGMSLVPANDPAAPNDYFLFVANDNDFLTSDGQIVGPDGTLVDYNAFSAHPAVRLPGADAITGQNQNDTMFLAYRVTIATVPEPGAALLLGLGAAALSCLRRRRS